MNVSTFKKIKKKKEKNERQTTKTEKETIKKKKETECHVWWTKYVCTSDNPTGE